MGRPKALLLFGGEPLIVHIVGALNRLCHDILVVAAPEQELPALPVTLVRDEVAYQGPVAGIYAVVTPKGLSFMNMNTPEDYELALKRWRSIFAVSPDAGG